MLIETLILRKTIPNSQVIRKILFKKGLNLIIDNTSSERTKTGNNVGKSTVIKVINLCLGAKSVKELYADTDTQSENVQIKDFLEENKIQAELIILDSRSNKRYTLKRDLFAKGHRYFNDEALNETSFNEKLNQVFFHLRVNTPSFRQLIAKFVRISTETEEKMLQLIKEQQGVLRVDMLRTRLFGAKVYVDIEIAADGDITLREGHEIAQVVHDKVEEEFPLVKHCMVHVNPL